MVNHNIRAFAFTILGLAFSTYAVIFFLTQDINNIDFHKALSHVTTAISINIGFWFLFIKYFWKSKLFYPWLVQIPDISGKWSGKLKSNWKGSVKSEIPFELTVEQTFLNVHVRIKTEESNSVTIGASFNIDRDRDRQELIYSYLNTPKASVRDQSSIHYGSALLHFEGRLANHMHGEYWTSRGTAGEMVLKRLAKRKKT